MCSCSRTCPPPAAGADEVYLKEVDRCDVYLGLFGNEYGYEDAEGLSPTEREFDRATATGKERLIFVKGDRTPLVIRRCRSWCARLGRS